MRGAGFKMDYGLCVAFMSKLGARPALFRFVLTALRLSPSPLLTRAGGHDSLFHSNAVYTTNNWNFVNVAGMLTGHEDLIFDNDYVQSNMEKVSDLFDNCRETSPVVSILSYNNRFYTPLGNATATCDCCGMVTLEELQVINPRIESNHTISTLPSGATIIGWARQKVGLPPAA